MRDDPSVIALVIRAQKGDQSAWDEIVERYAPLVWTICRRYRLNRADTDDVGQSVWLRLVEGLSTLREPAALPGWLATTTQRECLRVVRAVQKQENNERLLDFDMAADEQSTMLEQELIIAERNAALRAAFALLPPQCRRLLSLLMQDPPSSYAEVHDKLKMPIGSIGPNRARCLDRLRKSPELAILVTSVESAGDESHA
jgi:RNA polymerase sigma factor (sigma-70 family)